MRAAIFIGLLAAVSGCAAATPRVAVDTNVPPAVGPARSPTSSRSVKAGAPSVAILEDAAEFWYGADGRKKTTYRLRYEILDASAIDAWGSVGAAWAPWHEKRPKLDATIELPSGQRLTLDPTTIEESSLRGSSSTYTDRRLLRAPLPGLVVGAIVQRVIVQEDEAPFFEGGELQRFFFGDSVEVKRSRVVIDVPASAPFDYRLVNIDLVPTEDKVVDGRRRMVFEAGPFKGESTYVANSPPETAARPHVVFSVAGTWAKLAQAYAEIIDRQLRDADVKNLADAAGDGPRLDKIQKIVDRLHKQVRYTGLEFGVNAIVPATPKSVLARGFGDCKDKAAILVAALRQRGIEAHIALLNAGFSPTTSDVVGLNAFNHAIVYVPDQEAPLWIDATADTVPVGSMPLSIQGRRALIARAGQDGLVEIPKSSSQQNAYFETREVVLANMDESSVVETTWGTGSMDSFVRAEFGQSDPSQLNESLEKYVKRSYGGTLGEVTIDERRGDSMRLRVEVKKATVASTNDFGASIRTKLAVLFSFLPAELTYLTPKDEEPNVRTTDMEFFNPYQASLEYRVQMPRGFVVRALPKNEDIAIGPAKLVRRFVVDGRMMNVVYRLDTGARRWSAEDVEAFKAAYAETTVEESIFFDHGGVRLIRDGKVKAGLDVYRAAIEAEPNVAVHHVRFAQGLLDAGFGDEGRRIAHHAAQMTPDDYYAQFVLGYALSADFFGRQNLVPTNRDGALAAYRRSKVAAPDNVMARQNIAVLLETNAAGVRYGPGSDLAAAAEEYRALRTDLDEHSLDMNLVIVLLRLGRTEEAEEVAKSLPASTDRNSLLAATAALRTGASSVADALRTEAVSDMATALTGAVGLLTRNRSYAAAADVMEMASAREGNLQARLAAAAMRTVRIHEQVTEETTGPKRALLEHVRMALTQGTSPQIDALRSKSSFAEQKRRVEIHPGSASHLHKSYGKLSPHVANTSASNRLVLVDTIFSTMSMVAEGSDAVGYRVSGHLGSGRAPAIFVVKERDRFAIRAFHHEHGSMGAQAAATQKSGQRDAAIQWLDWASETNLGVVLAGRFHHLWSKDGARDDAAIRRAAGLLMSDDSGTARTALSLLAAESDSNLDDATKTVLMLAKATAHNRLHEHARAVPYAREAYKQSRLEFHTLDSYVVALQRARHGNELRAVLEAEIMMRPKNEWLRAMHFDCLSGVIGDFKAADDFATAAIDAGIDSPRIRSDRAWNGLFIDPYKPGLLEDASKAASETKFARSNILHTLASVYAETERPTLALAAIQGVVDLDNGVVEEHDWFVIGRIAESYAMFEVARRAYERVKPSASHWKASTWVLAQRRLARLK